MTTIRLDESDGAGTHVFIVGVGGYDHLRGGNGKRIASDGGMGQLTSPPVSAAAMLKWVDTQLKNPRAPLKSIEVLISVDGPDAEYLRQDGQLVPIDRASYANFEEAAKAWFDRAHTNPDNVAIFYFCGHGLGDGVQTQLLMSDYGRSARPLREAVNFSSFRIAMRSCQARCQIFFVDACRVVDSALLIDPSNLGDSGLGPLNRAKMYRGSNPAFFAARTGEQAFAEPDSISDFTTALLSSLSKHGARRNKHQEWAVSPQTLQIAIAALMDDLSGNSHCDTDGISGTGFDLHVLDAEPEALLQVSVAPAHHQQGAQLRATGGGVARERYGAEHPWRTTLPMGESEITATFPPHFGLGPILVKDRVGTPLHEIELRVS